MLGDDVLSQIIKCSGGVSVGRTSGFRLVVTKLPAFSQPVLSAYLGAADELHLGTKNPHLSVRHGAVVDADFHRSFSPPDAEHGRKNA
ncbi:hypothetical protein SSCI18S_00028 [Sphingobium scionense]|jgi:hypothetical protein